jgi:hypothetical protein
VSPPSKSILTLVALEVDSGLGKEILQAKLIAVRKYAA